MYTPRGTSPGEVMPDDGEDTELRPRPTLGDETTALQVRPRARAKADGQLPSILDTCAALLLAAAVVSTGVAALQASNAASTATQAYTSASLAASDSASRALEAASGADVAGFAGARAQRDQADSFAQTALIADARRVAYSQMSVALLLAVLLAGFAPVSRTIATKGAFLALGSLVWVATTAWLTFVSFAP